MEELHAADSGSQCPQIIISQRGVGEKAAAKKKLGKAKGMVTLAKKGWANESLRDRNSDSEIPRTALHGQPDSFLLPLASPARQNRRALTVHARDGIAKAIPSIKANSYQTDEMNPLPCPECSPENYFSGAPTGKPFSRKGDLIWPR
jgi:hypothetical protein